MSYPLNQDLIHILEKYVFYLEKHSDNHKLFKIKKALESLMVFKENIYNIANSTEQITIYGLAKTIQSVFNPKCKIILGGKKTSNSPDIVSMNIDRYIKEFGLPHFISLHEGLKQIKN